MHKSKLLDVFYALPKNQQRALRKFLQSPYHNHRQDVIALYDHLMRCGDDQRDALRKESAFAAVYPNETYQAEQMDYVMSFLLKLIEEFLIFEHFRQDRLAGQLALVQEYRKMGIEKHFQQSLRHAKAAHAQLPFRDPDFLEKAAKIELEEYAFSAKQVRSAPRNLQQLSDTFDQYYLAQRLQYACLLLAHQSVYKTQYDRGTSEAAMEYVEARPQLLETPAIALYYYYLKAIQNKQEIHYFKQFKLCLLNNTKLLPIQEIYNLYIFAINYCVQQFNTGNDQLLPEVFELYKSGLEHSILLENGKLSQFAFKNITDIALRLNETAWAEQFVAQYRSLLDEKHREGYASYALSKLYYQQKRYREAMLYLQQLDYDDLFLTLSGKVTLLKIYYELGEWDALDALLASFQVFIHRKKQLPQTRRDNYKNIIRFIRKMVHLNPFDASEKQALIEEIRATTQLTERDWLLLQLGAGKS